MSSPSGPFANLAGVARRIDRWPVWALLFPRPKSGGDRLSLSKKIVVFGAVTALAYLACYFYRPGGMIGFDWIHFWSKSYIPSYYPPWTAWFLPLTGWNILIGISISGFAVLVAIRSSHLTSSILSFFCLPFFWVLLTGQIDGLATSGLVGLPLTIPLALIKPQLLVFALFSKRSYFIFVIVFLFITFTIFGFWPNSIMSMGSYQLLNRAEQNIGLGGWWTLLALVGLWFSRGDMDMMMLSGAVAVPYLIPYHLFPTVPAVSRLRPWAALVAALTSWLPLSANWIGPAGWWLGWIYVAWVWGNLAVERYADAPVIQHVHQLFSKQIKWKPTAQ